jgi:uncharacterized membrane-anchored protein
MQRFPSRQSGRRGAQNFGRTAAGIPAIERVLAQEKPRKKKRAHRFGWARFIEK